jgi:hypothetical protein
MPDEPLTGACLCGGVRFALNAPPVASQYCHCQRCQRRSGTAASVNAVAQPGSVEILAGAELVHCYVPPDGSPKCFCTECGSALWSKDRETGEIKGVRMGLFDRDPGVRPQWRQFVAYAAPWEPLPDDGLPRFDERKPH